MKKKIAKVVIFIGLKIVEISGFVFIPHFIGTLMINLGFPIDKSIPMCILPWTLGVIVILVAAMLGVGSYLLIIENKKLINKMFGE